MKKSKTLPHPRKHKTNFNAADALAAGYQLPVHGDAWCPDVDVTVACTEVNWAFMILKSSPARALWTGTHPDHGTAMATLYLN